MGRILASSLLISLLTACTTVSLQFPSSRFDSPETLGSGANRFLFGLGVASTQNVIFTDDASIRPPDLSRPRIETNNPLVGRFGWGLFEKFDLGLKTSVGPAPVRLTGKLQLLGDPQGRARSGNFSLALSGGVGYASPKWSGDHNGLLGPAGYRWNANVQALLSEAALIAGYRLFDPLLLYAGAFYEDYRVNGRIKHEKSDNGLSPEAEYEFTYDGYQTGVNAGVRIGFGAHPTYLILEGVYSKTALSHGLAMKDTGFGAELGCAF